MAESPVWSSYFEHFSGELDLESKAHLVRGFVDTIQKEMERIFKRALRSAKRNKELIS
jgi:hypothetical protein